MSTRRSAAGLLGLPWIPDILQLSFQLGLSEETLRSLVKSPERAYKRVLIPKRTRGYRELHCPNRTLKAVQSWILRNILESVKVDPAATAFKKGVGLLRNVQPHRQSHIFLCLDLEGFFDNVGYGKVRDIFLILGYSMTGAELLTRLCTVRGKLPQGGVTSPYLSNIACWRLDKRIRRFTSLRHVTYTRYADDITLSAKDPHHLYACAEFVKRIISEEGYKLNPAKTRVLFPHYRREITGLIVTNNHTVTTGRHKRRILRAMIHRLEVRRMRRPEREVLRNKVRGHLAFLNSVDRPAKLALEAYWTGLKASKASSRAAPSTTSTGEPTP